MKKNRMLAGVLATLMLLVAIPMVQVSAAVPTAPATYLSDSELLNAYELDYLGAKLNFKEGFSDSRCKWSPNNTGTATYTNEDGLVLDGAGKWSFALDSNWCALGENTKAIMFTLRKDTTNTSNMSIFLPYTAKRGERYLLDSSNTFKRHYDVNNTDYWKLFDGANGFACTERRYMVVRIGTEKSHIFIDRGNGKWLPFGPGMDVAFEDLDTAGVMGATGVSGEYTRASSISTSSFGTTGFVVENGAGKTYIKDITVYSKRPDSSVPVDNISTESLLTMYDMEEAKKIDFAQENFANSEDASEITWKANANTEGNVQYDTANGAVFTNGQLCWTNGSTEWIPFGKGTKAVSFTAKADMNTVGYLYINIPMPDGKGEKILLSSNGTPDVTAKGNLRRYNATGSDLKEASSWSTADGTYLVVYASEGTTHLYRKKPTDSTWRSLGSLSSLPTADYKKGVNFFIGGGNAIVKDITLYTEVPTATEPLALRDGVAGALVGDAQETLAQPTKLQASLFWGLDDDATLVIAGYDSAKNLKKVEIKKKSELTNNKYIFNATTDSAIASVKVFLWDGFTKLSPLAGSKEVKVSTVSQ